MLPFKVRFSWLRMGFWNVHVFDQIVLFPDFHEYTVNFVRFISRYSSNKSCEVILNSKPCWLYHRDRKKSKPTFRSLTNYIGSGKWLLEDWLPTFFIRPYRDVATYKWDVWVYLEYLYCCRHSHPDSTEPHQTPTDNSFRKEFTLGKEKITNHQESRCTKTSEPASHTWCVLCKSSHVGVHRGGNTRTCCQGQYCVTKTLLMCY